MSRYQINSLSTEEETERERVRERGTEKWGPHSKGNTGQLLGNNVHVLYAGC